MPEYKYVDRIPKRSKGMVGLVIYSEAFYN